MGKGNIKKIQLPFGCNCITSKKTPTNELVENQNSEYYNNYKKTN